MDKLLSCRWSPRISLIALPTLLLLIAGAAAHAQGVETLLIPPGVEKVIAMALENGDRVKGSISISGGPDNDINFWVIDPAGETILNLGRVGHYKDFEFQATQSGDYVLHFDNSFSISHSKAVTLTYHAERYQRVWALILGSETLLLIIGVALVVTVVIGLAAVTIRRTRKALLLPRLLALVIFPQAR